MLQSEQNSTKTTTELKSDISDTHLNAKEAHKVDYSNKTIERENVDGTPFEIITLLTKPEEKNTFLAIGNQRITELTTKEELIHQIQHGNWDLMVKVIVHICGRMIDGAEEMREAAINVKKEDERFQEAYKPH